MRSLIIFFTLCFFSMTSSFVFAEDFSVSTIDFLDTGAMPVLYTCDGKDISPILTIANPPAKTQSLAILVSDPESPQGTFYHWVVFNIPANTTELAEGITTLPAGSVVATNSFGKKQYNGPCPPRGSVHTYVYTVYALDTKLKLKADAKGADVLAAMKGHVVGEAKISGVYSRWLK